MQRAITASVLLVTFWGLSIQAQGPGRADDSPQARGGIEDGGYTKVSDRGYTRPIREVSTPSTGVTVEIVVDGTSAVVYRDGQFNWVEGRRGQRFAFRITNDNDFPVGVIPSADGQSLTTDGRAGSDNPAYVLRAHESITTGVWREDLRGGRQLVFTSVDRSLAARKGDTRNIGVLGVMVWQLEDRRQPPPPPIIRKEGRDDDVREPSRADRTSPSAGAAGKSEDEGIGVGYGERRSDPTQMTDRYRRVRVLGTVALYYDDRAGLERAGVDLDQYRLPEPDRRGSDPFPRDGYVGVRIP